MADAPPLTRLGAHARIGLLADTHCHAPGAADLPDRVLDAFRGVDLIVHLGDMGAAAVLDRLATVAPVVATRGRDDPPADDRVAPTVRVVEAGGLVVGATFDLAALSLASLDGQGLSVAVSAERIRKAFGRAVDIVVFGATHRALVASHRGVLLVNPGSATLPAEDGERTAAKLEIRDGVAAVESIRV